MSGTQLLLLAIFLGLVGLGAAGWHYTQSEDH